MAALLHVFAQQLHGLLIGPLDTGDHDQPSVLERHPLARLVALWLFAWRQVAAEAIHRRVTDAHELLAALFAREHRREQPPQVQRLAEPAAFGLFALLAVLIDEHHRQRGDDRHDQMARIVLR